MTEQEQAVLETLLELETAVNSMRTANPKPNLQNIFTRLDSLAAQLPKGTDPQLRHYLANKSYEKARVHLQRSAASTPHRSPNGVSGENPGVRGPS